MPRILLAAAILAVVVTPAVAQVPGLSGPVDFDLILGVESGPSYPGSDDGKLSPWLQFRNDISGGQDGLSFAPSFGLNGPRKSEDGLEGLEPIDRAVELGGRIAYGVGAVSAYGTLRRGFGGHEGVTGALGLRHRSDISSDLTLWSGIEAVYGNARFNDTYFGVTADESRVSGLPETAPGAGFYSAALIFEARYALSETTAVTGQVRYGRLIGDAVDSPVVSDKYQPSIRVGLSRRFSFGF
ncbi:MAG: MipA/OmpV family protein [Paracoccus sp. (in: a-proteobacteria)]|nr:MipA/OmpV family protein [Paracoccus sp. (in: a-proteobacteria)]